MLKHKFIGTKTVQRNQYVCLQMNFLLILTQAANYTLRLASPVSVMVWWVCIAVIK